MLDSASLISCSASASLDRIRATSPAPAPATYPRAYEWSMSSMMTWRRSSSPSMAVKPLRELIRLSATSAGMFGCFAWLCILSLLCALILQKQMAFAVSETSRSHDAVSIGRLEKNLHLLLHKLERP